MLAARWAFSVSKEKALQERRLGRLRCYLSVCPAIKVIASIIYGAIAALSFAARAFCEKRIGAAMLTPASALPSVMAAASETRIAKSCWRIDIIVSSGIMASSH